jgi:hypothetical protein
MKAYRCKEKQIFKRKAHNFYCFCAFTSCVFSKFENFENIFSNRICVYTEPYSILSIMLSGKAGLHLPILLEDWYHIWSWMRNTDMQTLRCDKQTNKMQIGLWIWHCEWHQNPVSNNLSHWGMCIKTQAYPQTLNFMYCRINQPRVCWVSNIHLY